MIREKSLENVIRQMNVDLHVFEEKYQGKFLEEPFAGRGNRKTKCINEATLPVITCLPVCLQRCARTCYVVTASTLFRTAVRKRQAQNTVLRRIDPNAYYEYFYQLAEKEHLPIRLSDGGDFENEAQVRACVAAAKRHPSVHAVLYTKRLELLEFLRDRPATLHARYSGWEDDKAGIDRARELGFDITTVVYDGSGNCPYQKSLARYEARSLELQKAFLAQGLDKKTAKKQAEKQADVEVKIWHCRFCAQHGTGCCKAGDIHFNVVGAAHWALK